MTRFRIQGVSHLDCTFNPIGKDKCIIIYKDGFVDESDYQLIIDIFGEENCFHITPEEMFEMNPKYFLYFARSGGFRRKLLPE